MSWDAVARKDFQDSVRSWWFWGLSAFFVLLIGAGAYFVRPAPGEQVSSNAALSLLTEVTSLLVPLIALVMAYRAIVGERESGSLKLLLSLPNSRSDVVFGKVLGRTAAVAVPVVGGFLLAAIIFVVGPMTFEGGPYLTYTLLTALLGAAFVGIAVGFSTVSPSQRLAMGGAVAVYFVFGPLWGAIRFPLQLYLMTRGQDLPVDPQQLFTAFNQINPSAAYKTLARNALEGSLLSGADSFVASDGFALVMFLFWLLVPPLAGYLVFERADL